MKDEQGIHIINPETLKIIRNLRAKAIFEGKRNRNYYLDQIIKKYSEPMRILELHAQEWCMDNGIMSYDHITNVSFVNVKKESK